MNGLTQFSLILQSKPTKMFLSRQQVIEKIKKEKENKSLQSSRIQNKKIFKPQSVMKVSTTKASTQKYSQQKKIFSCSKFQVNELVPDYQLICKNTEKNGLGQTQTLNTEYFNFVNKKQKGNQQDEKENIDQFQQMKLELLRSFQDIETKLLKKQS